MGTQKLSSPTETFTNYFILISVTIFSLTIVAIFPLISLTIYIQSQRAVKTKLEIMERQERKIQEKLLEEKLKKERQQEKERKRHNRRRQRREVMRLRLHVPPVSLF